METAITAYLADIVDAFLNPQKRIFIGYLAAALGIATTFYLIAARGERHSGFNALYRKVLSPRIWWSASARADYKLFAINNAIMLGLAPKLLSHLALAVLLFECFHEFFGVPPMWGDHIPAWVVIASFTITHFVLDDLSRYLVHRLLHRSDFLWSFHKVHHSAETLTPFTVFRTHPVEGVVFTLRGAVVQGVVIGSFVFFFGESVDLATVLGVNLFLFVFNATGANLRHSHVSISYGVALERILISPAQHQLHHSMDPQHFDKNFGVVLALWDLIGGSLCPAERGKNIKFGLSTGAPRPGHTLGQLYLAPFGEAARISCRGLHSLKNKIVVMSFLQGTSGRSIGLINRLRPITVAMAILLATLVFAAAGVAAGERPLDIYSHRQPFLIEPFIAAYQQETGVEVNIVYASKGLVQRLIAEGKRSPADLVLTVDIGRLAIYADQDLLAQVDSKILQRNVPAHLRDSDNRWFALSKRVRVLAVSNSRVGLGEIQHIEELADARWKGRICTRPGSHVYNRALMASMIDAHGAEKARVWARGLVTNLARRPQGNDRAQLKAIYQGECDIAIINHYYWGKLKYGNIPEQEKWADAVRVVFTNQNGRGNHVNISGGGVTKHADNKSGAVRFLEFLSEPEAQALYGTVNFEFPVNRSVTPTKELQALGTFKEDDVPIARIAELGPAAQRIIDQVGW